MATSRRVATSENIQTYDSGGGKDFTSLSTWEQATDIDMVAATQSEVLECFASQDHDDRVTIASGVGDTDASFFRIIRPATSARHTGKPSTGVRFISTANISVFSSNEDFFQLQDVSIKFTTDDANNRFGFELSTGGTNTVVGVMVFDGTNAGAGAATGFFLNEAGSKAINCLSHNNAGLGFLSFNNGTIYYNCNAIENGQQGFRGGGTSPAKNCISEGNTGADFLNVTQTTCTTSTPTYVDGANDDFHLASADTVGIDNGTDLSGDGTFAFDDDIDFETITGTWDIGFDEFVAAAGIVRRNLALMGVGR